MCGKRVCVFLLWDPHEESKELVHAWLWVLPTCIVSPSPSWTYQELECVSWPGLSELKLCLCFFLGLHEDVLEVPSCRLIPRDLQTCKIQISSYKLWASGSFEVCLSQSVTPLLSADTAGTELCSETLLGWLKDKQTNTALYGNTTSFRSALSLVHWSAFLHPRWQWQVDFRLTPACSLWCDTALCSVNTHFSMSSVRLFLFTVLPLSWLGVYLRENPATDRSCCSRTSYLLGGAGVFRMMDSDPVALGRWGPVKGSQQM